MTKTTVYIQDGMTLKLEDGNLVEFFYDHDASMPTDGDDAIKIAILHSKYTNPAPECGSTACELQEWTTENEADWAIFPLFLYDHGNQCYRASEGDNPFSCRWDSGRVGIIALRKNDFGTDDFLKTANSYLEEFTDWANGECYGYEVKDTQGNHIDGCSGFYGSNIDDNGMRQHLPPISSEPYDIAA